EAPALESRMAGNFSLNSSGFFGGGQLGYNYQFNNNIVAGIEADFQWSGIEGNAMGATQVAANGALVGSASFDVGSEVEWFGTIRGRLGYAWDRALLYGTGGVAYGSVKSHATFSVSNGAGPLAPLTDTVSASKTQWGWTAGAGLQYALSRDWSFKTEYQYI